MHKRQVRSCPTVVWFTVFGERDAIAFAPRNGKGFNHRYDFDYLKGYHSPRYPVPAIITQETFYFAHGYVASWLLHLNAMTIGAR